MNRFLQFFTVLALCKWEKMKLTTCNYCILFKSLLFNWFAFLFTFYPFFVFCCCVLWLTLILLFHSYSRPQVSICSNCSHRWRAVWWISNYKNLTDHIYSSATMLMVNGICDRLYPSMIHSHNLTFLVIDCKVFNRQS